MVFGTVSLGRAHSAHAQELTWLPQPFDRNADVTRVSADGRLVIGSLSSGGSHAVGVYWLDGRLTGMRSPDGLPVGALNDVSADGRTITGFMSAGSFRWRNGQFDSIGIPQSYTTSAWGISSDGNIVVGSRYGWDNRFYAFIWQNGVIEYLSPPEGSDSCSAYHGSTDGRIIVGASPQGAVRWVNRTPEVLDNPPGLAYSSAQRVSYDGEVILVRAQDAQGRFRFYLWSNGTTQLLEGVAHAYDLSGDGNTVVGFGISAQGRNFACRWRHGILENLNDVYAQILPAGTRLTEAKSVSYDGRYIIGYGVLQNRLHPFILDTWHTGDTNGDGCVDDADLLNVINAFGTPGTGYTRHEEDVNNDGLVDDADLLLVLFNFGNGC